MDVNVLCTGSKGFVGRNLVERLKKNHTVFEFNRGDSLVMKDIDVVFHLACDADSRTSNQRMASATENNIGIFTKVLEEAIRSKVKRFVYVSSIEVEEEKNVYVINKQACEKILQLAPLEWVIVRPYNLYGKYMDLKDGNRNVIANFLTCIKKNVPKKIIESGKLYRFTHVSVLIDTLIDTMTDYTNMVVNVGSSLPMTVSELSDLLDGITTTWDWVKKQKV